MMLLQIDVAGSLQALAYRLLSRRDHGNSLLCQTGATTAPWFQDFVTSSGRFSGLIYATAGAPVSEACMVWIRLAERTRRKVKACSGRGWSCSRGPGRTPEMLPRPKRIVAAAALASGSLPAHHGRLSRVPVATGLLITRPGPVQLADASLTLQGRSRL